MIEHRSVHSLYGGFHSMKMTYFQKLNHIYMIFDIMIETSMLLGSRKIYSYHQPIIKYLNSQDINAANLTVEYVNHVLTILRNILTHSTLNV